MGKVSNFVILDADETDELMCPDCDSNTFKILLIDNKVIGYLCRDCNLFIEKENGTDNNLDTA